jgi:NADPH-dependent glutamate synthase beta subunit-like oxidoreductase
VKIFESDPEIGGLLRTGIPEFRLPEELVDREIDRILDLGIEVETDHHIDRRSLLELARDHDAVLVATGQQLRSRRRAGRHRPAVATRTATWNEWHGRRGTGNRFP